MKKLLEIFKEEISEQARAEGRQYSLPVVMYLSVIEISEWMNANAKRKEIKKLLGVEFFKASSYDLEVIKEILDNKNLTHMSAFHAQQALEKSLRFTILKNY
jgi:hypothetical protein